MGGISTGERGWIRCWYKRTRRLRRDSGEVEAVVVMDEDGEDWWTRVWLGR